MVENLPFRKGGMILAKRLLRVNRRRINLFHTGFSSDLACLSRGFFQILRVEMAY